jgi:hypothetical protein
LRSQGECGKHNAEPEVFVFVKPRLGQWLGIIWDSASPQMKSHHM